MTLIELCKSRENQKISLPEFLELFKDEDECLEFYFHALYEGKECSCGKSIVENYVRISRKNSNGIPKKAFRCRTCLIYIYPLSKTIFRQTHIPITTIFYILYDICLSRSSISPSYFAQNTSVTYKTMHRIMMLIRTALYSSYNYKMKGTIEVDEAFIGTGNKVYNWSGISTRKEPIIGLIERETKHLRLFLVPNRKALTIHKLILDNVQLGSTVYTDSWRGYYGLSQWYVHESVDHSKKEYCRGAVSTNSIESVWRQFKRSLRKTHIHITDKYVQQYLNEAAWRHNSKGKTSMQLFREFIVRTSFIPIFDVDTAKCEVKSF